MSTTERMLTLLGWSVVALVVYAALAVLDRREKRSHKPARPAADPDASAGRANHHGR